MSLAAEFLLVFVVIVGLAVALVCGGAIASGLLALIAAGSCIGIAFELHRAGSERP